MNDVFIISILLMNLFQQNGGESEDKVKIRMDMIIIRDCSANVRSDYHKLIDRAIPAISKRLQISNDYTNVAVITFGSGQVILNFTDSETRFETMAAKRDNSCGKSLRFEALEVAEKLKQSGRPNVRKIIVLITSGYTQYPKNAETVAQNLLEQGVLIYVFEVGIATIETYMHLKNITGTEGRIFSLQNLDEFLKTFTSGVINDIKDQECKVFHAECAFQDAAQKVCVPLWWWPSALKFCPKPTSTPKVCSQKDCAATCDRWWPWNDSICTCDSSISRLDKNLFTELLANCPVEKPCPLCSTSSAVLTDPALNVTFDSGSIQRANTDLSFKDGNKDTYFKQIVTTWWWIVPLAAVVIILLIVGALLMKSRSTKRKNLCEDDSQLPMSDPAVSSDMEVNGLQKETSHPSKSPVQKSNLHSFTPSVIGSEKEKGLDESIQTSIHDDHFYKSGNSVSRL